MGRVIWMIARIINYCCSLSFSHSFSSFSCVHVGSEIPYTSIPSFLFCSPITTYFAWQSSSLYCPLNHTHISLLCLKLYEAFCHSNSVIYIYINQFLNFYLELLLLLLNRAFIDQSFGENCPNCRKEGGKMSQDFKIFSKLKKSGEKETSGLGNWWESCWVIAYCYTLLIPNLALKNLVFHILVQDLALWVCMSKWNSNLGYKVCNSRMVIG